MHVKLLDASDDSQLIDFLDRLSAETGIGLAYHSPFYRDALVRVGVGSPLYAGAFRDDTLIGVLPGFIKTTDNGTVYNSLPFFGPNAGVQCLPENNDCHAPLFSFLMEHLRSEYDMLSAAVYSPFLADTDEHYTQLQADIVVDKFTHYIDMENHTLPGVRRRDINTARKRDVTIIDNPSRDELTEVFEIYKTNCTDYGIELKPWPLFEYFLENYDSDNLLVSAAVHDGTIIAGLITLYSKGVASYYIPCQKHETRSLQPVPFLIDHHMDKVKEAGVRYWNWESSPGLDSGVAFFKKKWNSIEGNYKIHVIPFRPQSDFSKLGVETIQRDYPWFFVYPFDKLSD